MQALATRTVDGNITVLPCIGSSHPLDDSSLYPEFCILESCTDSPPVHLCCKLFVARVHSLSIRVIEGHPYMIMFHDTVLPKSSGDRTEHFQFV